MNRLLSALLLSLSLLGSANAQYQIYTKPPVGSSSGGSGNLTVGTSTITGGSNGNVLYDNSGVLGEQAFPSISAGSLGGILYWDNVTGNGNINRAVITGVVCGNGTSTPTACSTVVTFTSGTARTLSTAAEIIVCTGPCTITPPALAAAGMQFCVQNDDNVGGAITLAATSGVQYENTARTSYKSANTALVSNGAIANQICMVAISATKWNVFSSVGTWS